MDERKDRYTNCLLHLLPAYAQTSTSMDAHFPRGSGTTLSASNVASAASCLPIIIRRTKRTRIRTKTITPSTTTTIITILITGLITAYPLGGSSSVTVPIELEVSGVGFCEERKTRRN